MSNAQFFMVLLIVLFEIAIGGVVISKASRLRREDVIAWNNWCHLHDMPESWPPVGFGQKHPELLHIDLEKVK